MIHARGLHKRYGRVVAVDGVSVTANDGQILGLLGPNGAGKTTFIGLVTGQLRPSMGHVEVFGAAPFGNDAVLRRIGFEVHEGRYGEAGETYTVFACVRPQ